jgi:hypothetical protein
VERPNLLKAQEYTTVHKIHNIRRRSARILDAAGRRPSAAAQLLSAVRRAQTPRYRAKSMGGLWSRGAAATPGAGRAVKMSPPPGAAVEEGRHRHRHLVILRSRASRSPCQRWRWGAALLPALGTAVDRVNSSISFFCYP